MKIIKKIIGIIILLSLLPLVLLSIQLVEQKPIPYMDNITSNIFLQAITVGYMMSLCFGTISVLGTFAIDLIHE